MNKKLLPRQVTISSNPQCFNCNEFGHTLKDCTKEKRCGWCKKSGHHDTNCRKFVTFQNSIDSMMAGSGKAYDIAWLGMSGVSAAFAYRIHI